MRRLRGFAALCIFYSAGCTNDPAAVELITFELSIENVDDANQFLKSGTFETPLGATMPGPIGPGAAYEFTFTAGPGSRLSLVTMFVPSNDFFYAPDEAGIALFDASGTPVSGDVTAEIALWDAGTEVNQEPGLGPDQVQRQTGPNTGAADPDNTVRLAPDTFGNLPAVTDVIQVSLTPSGGTSFTVRIENVSTATTLSTSDGGMQAVPLSPGAWAVHGDPGPLFTSGAADRGDGLEAIAEDGSVGTLGSALAAETGVTIPLSPGVWVVHRDPDPLFAEGTADRGEGLEAIAEDGVPAQLAAALPARVGVESSAAFDTPVGASQPGAAGPGASYRVTFTARPGDRLSFATMFVQSNDLFYAPDGGGIALFDAAGVATSGEVTGQVLLWDAGTEVNEEPGVGPNQVIRQSAPDTGPAEGGTVRRIANVSDGFSYPAVGSVIRVTVTPRP